MNSSDWICILIGVAIYAAGVFVFVIGYGWVRHPFDPPDVLPSRSRILTL